MTRAHRIANIRCCSAVTPVTVLVFGGPARLASNALQEPSSFRGKNLLEMKFFLLAKALNLIDFERTKIYVAVPF